MRAEALVKIMTTLKLFDCGYSPARARCPQYAALAAYARQHMVRYMQNNSDCGVNESDST